MKRRALNLLVALDQLAWVILTLGHGHPDETISAALWRMESQGKWAGIIFRPLVDLLFWFDKDHCLNSWRAERRGEQLPVAYRSGND